MIPVGVYVFIGGLILGWLSFVHARRQNYIIAILSLTSLALLLNSYMAATPFLQPWDERYHALVAKNLMEHPLVPTLYDNPILPYDFKEWSGNHVWVHKQPVTLWGISLSLKIFGNHVFAVRLPSVLMATASVIISYQIGKRLFSERIGFLAAFFIAVNGLLLELVGARMATDHVDVFFMFFVLLAILFAVLFSQSKRYWWNVACAVSIGLAILCKWLPALIVLPVWLSLVLHYSISWRKVWVQGIVLVTVIAVVVIPWQLYIYTKFPQEAAWESHYNVLHLLKDLENTGKPWYYYADVMRVSYGELIYIPIIWLGYRIVKGRFDRRYIALFVWALVPSIFFSFSATKLQGYTLFSAGALFLITALFLDALFRKELLPKTNWLRSILVVVVMMLPIRYCIERLKPFQSFSETPLWHKNMMRFSEQIKGVDNVVVFNTDHPIEYMFHSNAIAYKRIPDEKAMDSIDGKGYVIYIAPEKGVPVLRVP